MSMSRVSARHLRAIIGLVFACAIGLTSTMTVRAKGTTLADKLSRGPGISNHPVHMLPSSAVTIPTSLPLDSDGTIGCLTCHQELPSLAGGTDPMLRGFDASMQDPSEFCIRCHSSGNQRSAAGMHWMALGRAHILGSGEASKRNAGSLDDESRRCMSCHDGVTAGEFTNSTPWTRGPADMGDNRRNHPVGVNYRRRSGDRRETLMRTEALLPSEIRLPNGRVGCVSCHNLYASDRYRLTVPVEGSKLCFACHAMD